MPLAQQLRGVLRKEKRREALGQKNEEAIFMAELPERIKQEARRGNQWLEVIELNDDYYPGATRLEPYFPIRVRKSVSQFKGLAKRVAKWLLDEGFEVCVERKPPPRQATQPEDNILNTWLIAYWEL